MKRIIPILLLAGGLYLPSLEAQNAGLAGYAIYLDQDFFIPAKNEDRDYTMGLGIEWFWDADPQAVGFLDRALEAIDKRIGPKGTSHSFQKSLMFGSLTFTPEDLANSSPIFDDRPYASLLYLSGKRIAIRQGDPSHRDSILGTELLVGLLGSGFSEFFQTKFHQAYRSVSNTDEPVDPLGWSNQISEGGEPTLRYRVTFAQEWLDEEWFDLSYGSDLNLGFQTNASLGAQFRIGKRQSGFWTLPYDPINRGSFIPDSRQSEFYVWGAYRARFVGYDALIQGQFRNSEVTANSSGIERLVHESGIGATYGQSAFQLSISASYKSPELKNAIERSHFWGTIAFVWRLD